MKKKDKVNELIDKLRSTPIIFDVETPAPKEPTTKEILDKLYKDVEEVEDDLDDVFETSPPVNSVSREKALMESTRKHYPNDGGLLYLKIYLAHSGLMAGPLWVNWESWSELRSLDGEFSLPEFVTIRTRNYLKIDSIEHGKNWNSVNLFMESHPKEYDYAIGLIHYHYKCDLNEEAVEYLVYTHPPVVVIEDEEFGTFASDEERTKFIAEKYEAIDTFVDEDEEEPDFDEPKSFTWYNRSVLRQGLGKGKENSAFLTKILNTHDTKDVLTISDECIFDELERDFPNFRDVINFYKAQFRLCALTGRTRISPILLLGPPGVGKTLFSKKLAQVLKTGFTFIDMASASSAWVLSGLHATWHGAKSGKIFDAMLYSPTASPIVVLDEIEKPVNPERDPKNALYQLLEENSASEFVDEFVDYPVNLSSIIYIACANGLDGISEPLLTRFKIFDIAPPSAEEQAKIIKKMYLVEIEGSNLFSNHLDSAIVDSLLTDSLREVKSKISDAVGMALLEHTPIEIFVLRTKPELNISLELRHFKNHHKKVVAKIGF